MALVVGTNAYTDAATADAYFADNLRNADWTALSASVKDQALVTAAQRISLKVVAACKLPILPANISAGLEAANAEYALSMALSPELITNTNTNSNISKLKAGSAEIQYFRFEQGSGTQFPQNVLDLLVGANCLPTTFNVGDLSYVSGTTVTTSFSDVEIFPLNEGY